MSKTPIPPELGRKTAEIHTVVLYKANAILSVLLIFMNVPSLVANLVTGEALGLILAKLVVCLLSFAYAGYAFNAFFSRIVIYQNGLVIQNLVKQDAFAAEEIENFNFERWHSQRPGIWVNFKSRESIWIARRKYEDLAPLIAFGEANKLNVSMEDLPH